MFGWRNLQLVNKKMNILYDMLMFRCIYVVYVKFRRNRGLFFFNPPWYKSYAVLKSCDQPNCMVFWGKTREKSSSHRAFILAAFTVGPYTSISWKTNFLSNSLKKIKYEIKRNKWKHRAQYFVKLLISEITIFWQIFTEIHITLQFLRWY